MEPFLSLISGMRKPIVLIRSAIDTLPGVEKRGEIRLTRHMRGDNMPACQDWRLQRGGEGPLDACRRRPTSYWDPKSASI